MNSNICHVHGDKFAACRGLPHPSRTLYCDGQGSLPAYKGLPDRKGRTWGECSACSVWFTLRSDGTVRAHNGRGR